MVRVIIFCRKIGQNQYLRIKNWKTLVGGAAVTEEILRRLNIKPSTTAVLGTTPHQHMYGLEATVFLGLGGGYCVHDRAIFFPADIETAVAEAQASGFKKAVLVTSPAHLKFLEQAIIETPEICAVISATAPLPHAQADRLESRGDITVMEIYGSTETGSLGIRRTVDGDSWEPVAGFHLVKTVEGTRASAPHLSESCLLGDLIDLLPGNRFRLRGRTGDMIGIAGKRANLSALNAILSETPGLHDGVVLRRRTEGDDQLAVVAVLDPEREMTEETGKTVIRNQFLAHVDGVFAPRRICFVDSLPRSPTGKLTANDLHLLERLVWGPDSHLI